MERILIVYMLVALLTSVRGAPTEQFRRDVGHPQWHHGNFADVSGTVKAEAKHLLHTLGRIPFRVPLEVNLVLLGFNGDGAFRFSVDASSLLTFMKKTFPRHRPAYLETGEPLDIEHDLVYTISNVNDKELLKLEWETRKNMVAAEGKARQTEWGRWMPLYEVEATRLEPVFDRLYESLFNYNKDSRIPDMNRPVPNVIFIVNYDKVRMDPQQENNTTSLEETISTKIDPLSPEQMLEQEGKYVYRYVYNGGAGTQVWLSSGRYAVIDLSAGPCVYGRVDSEEGSVSWRSVPRLKNLLFPQQGERLEGKDIQASFQGLLSALVISAIEHVISPDVRFANVEPAKRLLVPVIILSNHDQYNPLQAGSNFSIDMRAIETEVKRLAPPGQEVVVVGGVHNLHDHEKLAMAVRKSIRGFSVQESRGSRWKVRTRTYLDGALLREEMRHSTDLLAAGILEASEPHLISNFFYEKNNMFTIRETDLELSLEDSVIISTAAKYKPLREKYEPKKDLARRKKDEDEGLAKTYGTRILPVFVFSLADVNPELLMEGEDLVWFSHDSVFVLQHDNNSVPLSYVSDTKRIVAEANSPLRHIIAGLASVVGGLAAPYEKASHTHSRPMHSWLWASGHHPFGPFSNTSSISQLLVDTCWRNTIYERVDRALRDTREANERIQTFVTQYVHTPVEKNARGAKAEANLDLWIDMFHDKITSEATHVPKNTFEEVKKNLDNLEAHLVHLASLLYDHRLEDAFENSTHLIQTSQGAADYVDHVLWFLKERLRCCEVEYKSPTQSSFAYVYGGILVAGLLAYFLVMFSSVRRGEEGFSSLPRRVQKTKLRTNWAWPKVPRFRLNFQQLGFGANGRRKGDLVAP